MSAAQTIWILALVLSLVAGWTDWRRRRVPNWLTVPALIIGIGVHTMIAGWPGAKASLEGAGTALGLLLPLVLMRAMGAGDWKLMGALGALLGPILILFVLVASIFVSGLMAVVEVLRTHRVKTTLHNLGVLVQGFFAFGPRTRPEISLDNPGLLKLPFGVAVAAATLICFVAARLGL